MKHALLLMLLVGCSANDPPSDSLDGGDAGLAESGFDAQSLCPATNPRSGACSIPGVGCAYDFNEAGEPERCDCVAPENQWICCRRFMALCPHAESEFPFTAVGQLCCPGDAPLFPRVGIGNGCTLCYQGGHLADVECNSNDRHWRRIDSTCDNPFPDAGVDAAVDALAPDAGDASAD